MTLVIKFKINSYTIKKKNHREKGHNFSQGHKLYILEIRYPSD